MNLNKIQYEYKEYSQTLYQSVLRIGFSFPIKVNIIDGHYYCVDGHKRLSILNDLLKENPSYQKGDDVTIIVLNNGNSRSNDCWRSRNTH